jgi:hypothetical protein
MSSHRPALVRVLRSAGAVRGLGQYLTWEDVLALLNTSRASRNAFLRHPDAILETFVPAFSRLAPRKDGDRGVPLNIEHWILFSACSLTAEVWVTIMLTICCSRNILTFPLILSTPNCHGLVPLEPTGTAFVVVSPRFGC